MAEQPYSIDLDLKEVRAMVRSLVPYIYEDDLYGRIQIDSARLTPGAILLRLRRLTALRDQMSQSQQQQLDSILTDHDKQRTEWQVAYTKKCVREVESRVRDLNTYLTECKENERLCASAYLPEALRRTIVEEIMQALPDDEPASADLRTKVRSIDGGLRRYVRETPFIWDQQLQPLYPADHYWWLYNRPPKPD